MSDKHEPLADPAGASYRDSESAAGFVFVVEDYIDQIKRRTVKDQERRERMWAHSKQAKFPTKEAAGAYLIERAAKRVAKAERELKAEKRRYANCVAKFLADSTKRSSVIAGLAESSTEPKTSTSQKGI